MIYRKNKGKVVLSFVLSAAIGTLCVTGYIKHPDDVNRITKKIAFSVAKLELNSRQADDKSVVAQASVNGNKSSNDEEVKKSSVPALLSDGGSEKDIDDSVTVSQQPLWRIELAPEENETPAPADQPEQPSVKSSDVAGAKPYPKSIENKSGEIKEVTFKANAGTQYVNLPAGQVRNCTSVSNSTLLDESKKMPEFKIEKNSQPQVLIMHTHTTESYEPYQRNFFDASFNSRTTDMTKNVCAVGDQIAAQLKNAGIGVIHDTTVHDYPQYPGSYQRSIKTVQALLKKYPSIKVVLDIHRDAICVNDKLRTAPVTTINGKKAAQVMIISGCDNGKMNMPNYMKNFRFASLFQQTMESSYPTLTRPVLFDYRNYNQQLTTGSLLVEIGSHANSIDEAVYSGQLVGQALVKTLDKCK